jgi:hypothetical protein
VTGGVCEEIAQNVAQSVFCLNEYVSMEESSPKIFATFLKISKSKPK